MPIPDSDSRVEDLDRMEQEWQNRVTYPTGLFNADWIRRATVQDSFIERRVPLGLQSRDLKKGRNAPLALEVNSFIALGPQPERMTGCSGCFNFGTTEGRVNAIAVDPTTTTNGSIVAYSASVGGGVWKTTNCCSDMTTWTAVTDDPLISTISIDTLAIDPSNHNTIY